jgi:hypothetical protein
MDKKPQTKTPSSSQKNQQSKQQQQQQGNKAPAKKPGSNW